MDNTLKKIRQYRELSQQQAADKLGVSRQTYWRMEKYPDMVTIKDAKKIGEIFGIDPAKIFFTSEIKLNVI